METATATVAPTILLYIVTDELPTVFTRQFCRVNTTFVSASATSSAFVLPAVSPASLVLPSYDVPLYLFIKNNTIPVNKHNNAINKIPSNGNLKIYLHESVKH